MASVPRSGRLKPEGQKAINLGNTSWSLMPLERKTAIESRIQSGRSLPKLSGSGFNGITSLGSVHIETISWRRAYKAIHFLPFVVGDCTLVITDVGGNQPSYGTVHGIEFN